MTTTYRAIIREIDPGVNAAGVEASMRLQHGTLNHLSRETFRDEIEIARQCEIREPGFLRQCARSFGQAAEYEADEKRLERARRAAASRTRPLLQPASRRTAPTAKHR